MIMGNLRTFAIMGNLTRHVVIVVIVNSKIYLFNCYFLSPTIHLQYKFL